MSSLVHSFNTSTACVQRFHSEEILSESAKILSEIPNASTVERFRLVTSYMLHARMQPNVVDVVRMKIIKVFFYSKLCTRLQVYGTVRRDRAASDGDVYSIGRHPTTNTGERGDANDECRRIEKGYVSAVCVSVAYGP